MVKEETVLIIGAGASCSYGFSTGNRLRKKLIQLANEVSKQKATSNSKFDVIRRTIQQSGIKKPYEALKEFSEAFNKSLLDSIDRFVYIRPEFERIAKILISYIILDEERKSTIYNIESNEPDDNWLFYLWNCLFTYDKYDFRRNHLTIVTYNYDRLIEYFLINAIRNSYDLTEEEAIKVNSIPVFHIHGQVGDLGLFNRYKNYIPFGEQHNIKNLTNASSSIHILYENQNNNDIGNAIHKIREARYIYFMGFGYDKLNLQKLGFDKLDKIDGVKIMGTSKNMELNEINSILNRELFEDNLYPCTCLEFLRKYNVSIKR